MFQSLRVNNPVYIFHKGDKPFLEIGYVASIPSTRPRYPVPNSFGQSQESVVDLTVKIGSQTVNYASIPAHLDIADSFSNNEAIVISDNKEAMNAEILSLKQKSTEIIDSIEFHKNFITSCDKILADLNPEFAEKQAQRVEIEDLKQQMSSMSKSITELMEANRLLLGQLKKEN